MRAWRVQPPGSQGYHGRGQGKSGGLWTPVLGASCSSHGPWTGFLYFLFSHHLMDLPVMLSTLIVSLTFSSRHHMSWREAVPKAKERIYYVIAYHFLERLCRNWHQSCRIKVIHMCVWMDHLCIHTCSCVYITISTSWEALWIYIKIYFTYKIWKYILIHILHLFFILW